ncbi:unnamed protein product [Durusdinium trenchii]|uniref:Uncharacterized protein n=1 Tax=Durusdinium trenchii TaxID=1381693 RepID=A0ABP0LI48_9DINO
MAALAEKDRGNASFKSSNFEQALASYTKALVLLGFRKSTDGEKGIFPQTSQEFPKRSLELSMALLSNRSLCFLKLGHTLDAIADAEEAVNRMDFTAGTPTNIPAFVKAKHRLATALMRAGRFKESLGHLDAIDQLNGNRTATIELRGVIKSLRQNCSAANSGYSTLTEHLKELKTGLMQDLLVTDAEAGWFVIREHFCNYPLLFLLDMPDLRKRMLKLPGKMLNLMAMVQRAQDPLNPYTGGKMTSFNVSKLEGMVENAYLQSENEREQRQAVLNLAANSQTGASAEAFASELGVSLEDHPEQEEVHQQLILLMRFILAYLQLDDFQWDAAKRTLHRLIFHVTVHPKAPKYFPDHINRTKSPERTDFKNPYLGSQELDIVAFPKWYLAELQHLLALCECGRGDFRSCQRAIECYFDLVPRTFQDRNSESALFLKAWAELKPLQLERPRDFAQIREQRRKALLKETMPIWKALEASYSKDCAGAFDTETWVEARFYHDLGFNPLPESFQEIQNNLQQQRKMQMPSFGDDDPFESFQNLEFFVGRAADVTVRFHTSSEEKARDSRRGRAPSNFGAFRGQGAFAMPDMENELYEMQQKLFASVLGAFGPRGGGLFGGAPADSEEEDEEEEEEEEEEKEEEEEENSQPLR